MTEPDISQIGEIVEVEDNNDNNISPNKLVINSNKPGLNGISNGNESIDNDKTKSIIDVKFEGQIENNQLKSTLNYSNKSIFNNLSNIFKTLIYPKDSNNNYFKDNNKDPNFSELISFYLYHSILVILYLLMSIYRFYCFSYNKFKLKSLNVAYNPSNTPSLINNDVNKLNKIPFRLSCILNYKPEQVENGGIEGLINDCCNISAWSISSGIPNLSIYEYNGILTKNIPELRRSIYKKLSLYFGSNNVPNFEIKIPHLNLSFYNYNDDEIEEDTENENENKVDLTISLLSIVDGRQTIVELTKVLSDLNKEGQIDSNKISIKFLDKELTKLIGIEPDLIILFQPFLNLQGYPPWHIRLSEMYWEPDNEDVNYAVFLRALQKYSTCKVNVGR